jgi:hypothetical protein
MKDVYDNHPGVLQDLELYPDLDAVWLQFTYSF